MRLLTILMALMILTLPALAEDAAKTEEETPITKWILAEQELVKDLSDRDKEVFYVIRNKVGLLRAVQIVRRDVGKAVDACAAENPDLKIVMETRFTDWENAVVPILESAEKFVDIEIDEQKVLKPSSFKNVLKLNDEAFEYQDNLIEKELVTDVKACKKLLKSMDRTEDDLVRLLQESLLPENVIRKRADKKT